MSSGATTFTVSSASGFPASVPFTLILERDTALEEIVTVNTISGVNVTSATRGVDGTSAVGHSAGAKVEHGVSARDFNEPQLHIAATSAVHGLTGSFVGTTDAQTLTNKTLTSPTINTPTVTSMTADAASTHGGVSGTTLAAMAGAWSNYTPTFSAALTLGNGTQQCRVAQIGKTVVVTGVVTLGSTSSITAAVTITVPIAAQTVPTTAGAGSLYFHDFSTGFTYGGFLTVAGSTATTYAFLPSSSTGQLAPLGSSTPFTWAVGDQLVYAYTFEAA